MIISMIGNLSRVAPSKSRYIKIQFAADICKIVQ